MRTVRYPGELEGNRNLSRGLSECNSPYLYPGDPGGAVELETAEDWNVGAQGMEHWKER